MPAAFKQLKRIYINRLYLLVTRNKERVLVELVTGTTARLWRAFVWTEYIGSSADRWFRVEPGNGVREMDFEGATKWLRNPDNRFIRLAAKHKPHYMRLPDYVNVVPHLY